MQDAELQMLRAEYDRQAGRSLALPIAGAIMWTLFGLAGVLLDQRPATFVLLFGSGLMFPLGLLIARLLGENLFANTSPLARLMGLSVLMVNLLWALHITLLTQNANLLPLSVGISLGLHWVVFSWIINHSVGIIHAILRTLLVTALWWLMPQQPILSVSIAVVIAYFYSIAILARRTPNMISS